jgi:hypothetical protein
MQTPPQRPQAEAQRLHASAATRRDLEDLARDARVPLDTVSQL